MNALSMMPANAMTLRAAKRQP
jgi:hypothetical protein